MENISKNRGGNAVAAITEFAQPVADEQGLSLWDVEFVKEGSIWYLRIYIDKPEGITLDDCERFHRKLGGILDKSDPIEQSYNLEVCSPGIERALKKPWHFEQMKGSGIVVKLIRPDETGSKTLKGKLKGYKDGIIILENYIKDKKEIEIKHSETSSVHLDYEYDEIETENIGGIE